MAASLLALSLNFNSRFSSPASQSETFVFQLPPVHHFNRWRYSYTSLPALSNREAMMLWISPLCGAAVAAFWKSAGSKDGRSVAPLSTEFNRKLSSCVSPFQKMNAKIEDARANTKQVHER